MGYFVRKADGQQHMGRIQRSRSACGTAGRAYPFPIQADQQRFPFDKPKTKVYIVRKPPPGIAVQSAIRNFLPDPFDQIISQPRFFPAPLFHMGKSKPCCRPEPYDAGHVFRTCPPSAFLLSSMQERTDLHPGADIKKSGAFRPMEFVAAGTEHIDIHLIDPNRQMGIRLHCVRMEQHTMFLC